ncbi:hypothetical protein GCM10007854_09670 [Algimonas porphyrae]|uniref:Uncharacterized protein n=1 Tax=Algimonas porphyrae TaxID=1128113 RepID=A0ABQ5UZ51_9PROT|nr:hypothetical protein GCM10007854_09670 [Algimonas porphyrae]
MAERPGRERMCRRFMLPLTPFLVSAAPEAGPSRTAREPSIRRCHDPASGVRPRNPQAMGRRRGRRNEPSAARGLCLATKRSFSFAPVTGQSPRLVSFLTMRVQIKSDAGDRLRLEKGACLQTDPSMPASPAFIAGTHQASLRKVRA